MLARWLSLALLPGSLAACMTVGSPGLPSEVGTQGKIIGDNDLVPVAQDGSNIPERYRGLIDAFGEISMGCTATHLGDGLVLTAGHCFDAPATRTEHLDCAGITVDWGVRAGAAGYLTSRCEDVLVAELNGDRDYAIFRVSPAPTAKVEVAATSQPALGSSLTIFSHPQLRPLEWSQTCTLQGADNAGRGVDEFSHQCDTEPGSSGAAILSDVTLAVVGIHDGGRAPWNYGTYLSQTPLSELLGATTP